MCRKCSILEIEMKHTKLLSFTKPKHQDLNTCPPGYEFHIRHKCYHIEAERVKWKQANVTCHQMGGNLVSIESNSEQNYIVEQLETSRGSAT